MPATERRRSLDEIARLGPKPWNAMCGRHGVPRTKINSSPSISTRATSTSGRHLAIVRNVAVFQ